MSLRKVFRSGSMSSYLVVGVIMMLVFVGTVYFVSQKSEQVRKSQEIATSTTKKPAAKSESSNNNSSQTNTADVGHANVNTQTTASSGNSASANLPETGPAELWWDVFAAGILVFAILEFVVSFRVRIRALSL